MASYRLWASFASKRHSAKGPGVNADFATVHERFLGVFDGVSGVAPLYLPEALSQDLRDGFSRLMTTRYEGNEWPQVFDDHVRSALGIDNNGQTPGKWLINLLALALYQGTKEGSTVAAVCSLHRDKLTYAVMGDCKVAHLHAV